MQTAAEPSTKQVADALRALADIVERAQDGTVVFWSAAHVALPPQFKSTGLTARLVAGMTGVTVTPYESETTHYLVYGGRLLGYSYEVMESQDD